MFIQQNIALSDSFRNKASLEKSLSEMNKDERLQQEKVPLTDMKRMFGRLYLIDLGNIKIQCYQDILFVIAALR